MVQINIKNVINDGTILIKINYQEEIEMKKLFDQFNKEDFYMIEFKMKEYKQNLSSFIKYNIMCPIFEFFLLISIYVFMRKLLPGRYPISYLLYFVFAISYIVSCYRLHRKKDKENRTYRNRQARNFFLGILAIGISFLMFGFLIFLNENPELISQFYTGKQLVNIINALFFVQIFTIPLSFIMMSVCLKLGYYKKMLQGKKEFNL